MIQRSLLAYFRRGPRLFMAAVMVLTLLSGCGGLGFGGPEPVEIQFAYLDRAADYQPLADLFHEQNPHITVLLEPIPLENDPVAALVARAPEMDAIRLHATMASEEVRQNFMPLDSLISTDDSLNSADLFTGSLQALEADGKLVGLPAGLDPFVVYYFPAKLAAAGVEVPSPDWTLEDFVASAVAVHNTDDAVLNTPRYAYGFCSHPSLPDLALFSFMFGGGIFNTNFIGEAPTLNSIENVQAVAWYASLARDFGLMPRGSVGQGLGRMLAARNCGYWLNFLEASIYGRELQLRDAKMLPLPTYMTAFNIATQDAYFVVSSSEHPEETYQWLRFLMDQPTASGALIPPLRSVVASDAYAQFAPADVLAVARSLPEQTVILGMDFEDERLTLALNAFSQAVELVIEEGVDPQAALDGAQQQLEQGLP